VTGIVLCCASAGAQIVVSANVDRAPTAGQRGDTATVIDLNVSPPKVIVELKVPAPPSRVLRKASPLLLTNRSPW
jgi:hypothetical protein